MTGPQPGISAPLSKHARFMTFQAIPGLDLRPTLSAFAQTVDGSATVIGLGSTLVAALGKPVPGLRPFPTFPSAKLSIPGAPAVLWCWIRGDDRGDLVHASRRVRAQLASAFTVNHTIDAFVHRDSRDLTGYEDGTENPTGEALEAAAFARDGSSFVAVQQWLHDLDAFESMPPQTQDDVIGRRRADNEEFDEAPESAHVKRTAQESFEPPAFVLRRSMPWADAERTGLVFVAFGHSFDAFEAQLRRMLGLEDGVQDALFTFTRPLTGSYFWCPPVSGGRVDLRAVL